MRPILFHLFDFPIYSYAFFIGIAAGVAFLITERLHETHRPINHLVLILSSVVIVSFLGAKLLFLLVTPESYKYTKLASFWLGGGLVFYGGLILPALFLIILYKSHKQLQLSDLGIFIPGLIIGHGIGRIGCFLAGCCYGSEFTFFIFTHHPVQIYEAVFLFLLGFYLYKKFKVRNFSKQSLMIYFISYPIVRFLLEFLRGDEIRGHFAFGLSTSQWISLIILLIVILVSMMSLRSKKI